MRIQIKTILLLCIFWGGGGGGEREREPSGQEKSQTESQK